MKYQIINTFDQIAPEPWDRLLTRTKFNSPFLKHGFQETWWSFLGGGEWDNANLKIISASENDTLVGIAPLFTIKNNGKTEVHFVGSFEICDYLDFIVAEVRSSEFINGVLDIVFDQFNETVDRVVLFNIPDVSPTIPALEKAAENDLYNVQIEKAYHTPAITLANDWETYLMGIDSKQRHEIRRKIRRAENSEEDSVAWYITGENDDLDQEIADFIAMMENDADKEKFLTEAMRSQMAATMRWAANEKILQLSFLTINEKKAAGYLSFDYADRIWVYNSGYNLGFRYYSPGWVLLGYLIQHAIENGKTHFDFMRGDEKYKYKFGAEDRFVMKAVIERGNA